MADFVSNHTSDRPVVNGIVGGQIEERRLEYAGKKHKFAGLRAVIGVDLLGSTNEPPVDRRAAESANVIVVNNNEPVGSLEPVDDRISTPATQDVSDQVVRDNLQL